MTEWSDFLIFLIGIGVGVFLTLAAIIVGMFIEAGEKTREVKR